MLVFHVNTTSDADTLRYAYEGLDGVKAFVNPSRSAVYKALESNPNEMAMFLGHGSPGGLFGGKGGYVLDSGMCSLLKDRETIGVWCHASDYARYYGCKGFFTSMFISNRGEARCYGYDATEEKCIEEDIKFAKWVKELIEAGTPLSEWPNILRGKADMGVDFVNFNYTRLEYFDGTQKPAYERITPIRFDGVDDEVRPYSGTTTRETSYGKLTDREWVKKFVQLKVKSVMDYDMERANILTEKITESVIEKLGDKFIDDNDTERAPKFSTTDVRKAYFDVIFEKLNQ